jgi:L-lactate dehydrogenase (cytochrome)
VNLTLARLARCHSIADLRHLARQRLPRPIFDCVEGGADDEVTMVRNRTAFSHYELVPRVLIDVGSVDLSTTVLGARIEWPVLLSPTGLTRLFHHHGEIAAARAASAAGTIYALSAASSTSIENVAAASAGPKWFQVYVWRDRGILREFIERCKAAKYAALCLTVDAAVFGQRERDLKSGLKLPPTPTLRTILSSALKPAWCYHLLTEPTIELANLSARVTSEANDPYSLAALDTLQFDPSVTWDDVSSMVELWGGPFAIKGILSVEDAKRVIDVGASAIVVSNHGGRQLDHAPATLDVLPEIVAAVEDRVEVLIDGGIRRGTDVLKALALGARACMIGRPYLYGIAAAGQAGAERALALLRGETERGMKLLGCRSLSQVDRRAVRRRSA